MSTLLPKIRISRRKRVQKTCIICFGQFEVQKHRKDNSKYCSRKCQFIGMKSIKRTQKFKDNLSQYNKSIGKVPPMHIGEKYSESHRQNISKALIGKSQPWNTGELNVNWRGDDVGYGALHDWVRSRLGTPDICEHCGKSGLKSRKIHWANKSREYKRDIIDWVRLCVPCHIRFDNSRKRLHGLDGRFITNLQIVV